MMGRIMAIDFGMKRTGIAVTDELRLIASGLTTVLTKDLMSFLEDYFNKEKVEELVVGQPTHADGIPLPIEKNIQFFIEDFEIKFPEIQVKREDERFTSKMAFQTMIDGGLKRKKRRDKATIDQVSATLILQSYMH
ncbi:putative pre-16S rRNA nuclease [Psychroflexus salis]|uniref:Putative pre-16S rRNA nuclease n=2 Tax=Psychroflexus salis TaxID=1526574 RepID=A0A917E7E0_9FLAO|nr:putative pre-16S rRNA nuclease [Psychroflexus salis]